VGGDRGGAAVTALVWVGVVALGGVGAIARFLLDAAVSERVPGGMPVGTLAVNVTGALGLGVLAGAHIGGDAMRLEGVGFVGAYTTFSTWMLESHRLAEEGESRAAALNVLGSLVVGYGALALGHWIGGRL
jgi:fluoride exporter